MGHVGEKLGLVFACNFNIPGFQLYSLFRFPQFNIFLLYFVFLSL